MSAEGFSEELDSTVDSLLLAGAGGIELSGAGAINFSGTGEVYGLPAVPSGATYAASKAYVDAQISGDWQNPVEVLRLIDDSLITAPAAPASGDAYIVDGLGGLWSVFAVGDLVEYDGQDWNNIVTQVGGFVPAGTRCLVGPIGAGGLAGRDLDVATAVGDGSWTFEDPAEGWAILVTGDGSYYENRAYTYNAATPAWVQIPPSVQWSEWTENDRWTASEAIALGDPVYMSGNDTVGVGDNSANATSRIVGIAAEAAASGEYIRIISLGPVPGVLVGATFGTPYYLDGAGGGLTTTRPTPAKRVIMVGYAINATTLWYEKTDYGK